MNKQNLINNFIVFIFCLLFFGLTTFSIKAQTCDSNNTPPVNKKGFQSGSLGSAIPVYIDPAITGDRRTAVETAFNNWNQGLSDSGANISFSFVTQPPPSQTGFTVLNQQHYAANDRAVTDTATHDTYGYTMYAITYLSPDTTNPAAVLEAMSHEIGHPLGFGECESCPQQNSSVMAISNNYQNNNDVTGRATTPSNCDLQKLRNTNYRTCLPVSEEQSCVLNWGYWDNPTCTCIPHSISGGGLIDPGGGIEPDPGFPANPCTPYYWHYYESYDGGETWVLLDVWYAGCF